MNLSKLFEPGKIGGIELKNRIVMAPLGHWSGREGCPTSRTIDYYVERAKGGVGLIVTGGSSVRPEARVPGMFWFYDDKFIPGLSELPKAVHQYGAKIAPQFNDVGKIMSQPSWRAATAGGADVDVVGPSPVPWVLNNFVPREATKRDIDYLVASLAEASLRAKKAGFDAVEIHGGHGYLVSDFLSPYTNRRTDEYGGTPEKRARFACEVIEQMKRKAGADFPIILRISASEYKEGGTKLEDTLRQVPLLVEAGVDALHITASASETVEWQFLTYLHPDAAIVPLAEAVKKIAKVPVIAVGKIPDPIMANRILKEGKADFVALGRPLWVDPELPNKAKEGRVDEIIHCIYCNNCLATSNEDKVRFGGQFCTLNPALFREKDFVLKPASPTKRVIVVGGGLAGMEAARVLAERGHKVTLYEKSDKLGGQWNIASQEEWKRHFASVTQRLSGGLEKAGVKVILNTEVTAQLVKDTHPDAVVIATGAHPINGDIPGSGGKNVAQANDVIMGKAKVGKTVVVIGGRQLGMETALSLAGQGKKVSLVTRHRLGGTGKKIAESLHKTLLRRLVESGVYFYPNCPIVEIRDNGVHIDFDHQLLFLRADTVVLAVGSRSENRLTEELKGSVPEIYAIGDCVQPRDALAAIREGAEVGRQV